MYFSSRNYISDDGISYKYKTFLWEEIQSYRWVDNAIRLVTNRKFTNKYALIAVKDSQKDEISKLLIEFIGDPVENVSKKIDEA